MHSTVSTAGSDQDLSLRVKELERELSEAHRREAATAEVLKVISRSDFDLHSVLETLVENAARLCSADQGFIFRLESELYRLAADFGTSQEFRDFIERHPMRSKRGTVVGTAAVERATVHVHDVLTDPEYGWGRSQALGGYRTVLAVPILKEASAIGVIVLWRTRVQPFTDRQIKLVESFADQALVAIDNARLFEEVRARTRELSEALAQQTVTADALKVISRSSFDLQTVLDTLAESATRLCDADHAWLFLRKGEFFRWVASYGHDSNVHARIREYFRPLQVPVDKGSITGRTALAGKVVQVPDVLADPEYTWGGAQKIGGYRAALGAPLLRNGNVVGVLFVARTVPRPFSPKHVELVETFADQAVIAVENVRLFEEVQARNRDLSVALEQQTATSELLKVIGRSTFDLKPVFETLIESAVKLCGATRGFISRFDGKLLRFAAGYNVTAELREYFERHPFALDRHSNTGRAALERRTVHNIDVRADPEYTYGGFQIDPYRTVLAIPMLKAGALLGVILIYRYEVLPFTDSQIALIETFADQAAIAIENTRLFEELQARNRDLTALGEVGRAVSSTLDLKVVLKTIVDRAVDLSSTDGGSIFYYSKELGTFELGETSGLSEEVVARFRKLDILARETGLGEAIARRQVLRLPDLTKRPSNPLRDAAIEAGFRAALIVPLLGAEGPLGTLVLQRRQPGEFPQAVVRLMQSFADQSVIALENARLFEEIAQKSRELEIASQHKSQFVANMSHELRTPLAAMLGYAELLKEGVYGALPDKSIATITRIQSNGKHLLGLINTVLDISKIEAGQFKLNLAEYAIGNVVETVRVATESLAAAKKLALETNVTKDLPQGLGDEQRLTQVLLNLVGNAIKFTDAGEVRITAVAANGHLALSVSDTGPGIPPQERDRIFEKFHQIDASSTRTKGGTGLGLAIAKQIVEMHGGRIWVESTLGQGSTFRMELPVRAAAAAGATS
jgi:signal transduction histidine kinase/putative methionine-R-sulfoxide reductase with GAF domain